MRIKQTSLINTKNRKNVRAIVINGVMGGYRKLFMRWKEAA
jgi:hypothetical protein